MALFITAFKIVGGLLVTLIVIGTTYQFVATKFDAHRYPPIGKMIDIGGYELHMLEMGKNFGGPTVVLESGSGCNSLDWSRVQPEIAQFARVVSVDRAGYAWSETSPKARTSENIVEELHMVLHNANIPKPYILVGHSFGGINVRLYGSNFPDEVAGVVLVDASHEDQYEKSPKPPKVLPYIMLINAAFGITRLIQHLPQFREMLKKYQFPDWALQSYLAQKSTTKFAQAMLQEINYLEESSNQLKRAGGLLGNKPLTVITAGKKITIKEAQGIFTAEQVEQFNNIWQKMQTDLIIKSANSKHIVAENSGHLIPMEQPEIIVEAVRDMIKKIVWL